MSDAKLFLQALLTANEVTEMLFTTVAVIEKKQRLPLVGFLLLTRFPDKCDPLQFVQLVNGSPVTHLNIATLVSIKI